MYNVLFQMLKILLYNVKTMSVNKSKDMKTDHSKKSLLDLEIIFYLECSFPNKILTSFGKWRMLYRMTFLFLYNRCDELFLNCSINKAIS